MAAARTAAFLWDGLVLHVGDRVDSQCLTVAPVQVALGIGGLVAAQTPGGDWVEGTCLVIGSNVPHTFRSGPFSLLWIEALSDVGRRLTEAFTRHAGIACAPITDVDELSACAAAVLADPSCETAWGLANDTLRSVAGTLPRGRVVHPAIRKALRLIGAQPRFKISAKELAAGVALSEGRFTHLFREYMGLPLRRYLMWRRVQSAVVLLVRGCPATQVAIETGFTDASHLNRALLMMLGARPSEFMAAHNLTVHVCSRPR